MGKHPGLRPLGTGQQAILLARFGWEQLRHRLNSRRHHLLDVKRLVTFAYNHTEFYRDKLTSAGIHPDDIKTWDDFAKVPFTTKRELIAAGPKAMVRRPIGLQVSRTSGSSGTFLAVHQNDAFWIKDSIVGVEAYKALLGLKASDHMLCANTSEYPYHSIGGLLYRVTYFDNLRPIAELLQTVETLRPTMLMVYPSIGTDLVEELKRRGMSGASLNLRAIITHSEQSAQRLRDHFSDFFGCPVYDEYATEELGRIGLQCKYQTLHLLEGKSYLETARLDTDELTKPGEVGEIVGTCLFNYTMPIIRYRQGDLASIVDTDCACGVPGRALQELHGRMNDSFVLADGRMLPSGRLLDWTYGLILNDGLDIKQFQLVQRDLKHAELRVVVGPGYKQNVDDQRIAESFRSTLTDSLKLTIKHQRSIGKTAAGKLVPIISKVAHDARAKYLHKSSRRLLDERR